MSFVRVARMIEQWKVIKEFPDYTVSNLGKVKNAITNQILRFYINNRGYYAISVGHKPTKHFYIHRLVMETFVGPCPNGMQVNHLDMNKLNNSLSNLEYCTAQENTNHAMENGAIGFFCKGEKHPNSKLSVNDVIKIRSLVLEGCSDSHIADIFGVHSSTIGAIRKKENWNFPEALSP